MSTELLPVMVSIYDIGCTQLPLTPEEVLLKLYAKPVTDFTPLLNFLSSIQIEL